MLEDRLIIPPAKSGYICIMNLITAKLLWLDMGIKDSGHFTSLQQLYALYYTV